MALAATAHMIGVMTPRGCVWEVIGASLIVTYYDDAVTPEQWLPYIKLMNDMRGRSEARFLIDCPEAPSRERLAQLAGAARGQSWRVALLSSSTAVRFAASTFSLIVKGFRFFPPDKVDEALQHLHCEGAEALQARSALTRVRGSFDL